MNLQEFKEKLFQLGGQHGFTDMELYYEREEKFACELFKGEIDSYDTSEVFGTSFRGLYEGRMGYAFTEKLDEESLSFLIENAKENSQFVEDEVQEEIFAGSEKYESGSYYSSSLADVTIAEKINLLKEIEKHIYAYDERVTGTDYFMVRSGEMERVLLNSKGLSLSEKCNHAGIYVSVIVKQGDQVKNGEYSKFTRDFSILNPEEIAKHAVEEALSQLNARSAESKNYPVLLRNDAASVLLQTYIPIFSAENTQKGQSALKGKTGEIIAVASLNIIDDPFLEEGMLSSNFDSEGVATARKDIVKDGRLVTLMHNRKTAQKDGVESTGNAYKASYKGALTVAPTNLYVNPSNQSYEELVSSLSEGIIITELSGLHSGANTVSGDFSIAANGYYVKDGKVQNAVNQMTIAGNFYKLLKNIEAIGSDLEFSMGFMATGYIGSPSLLIRELAVTVE
ncbi:TldD/PmbA family protein [Cytobacillus firmus]|uniref:Peptidase U62 modulator of DNA gyrase n=1 Tax=Cytobacillus firmus DS1 TaxID=1307436 RepID=W7LD38_CYTFI|nr:TldD/PmbA family protein [Cytobacillus firmus]EWG13117.1 peptidase U62 modulator of DNA gyrase [Cytobacillus firmus DS1]